MAFDVTLVDGETELSLRGRSWDASAFFVTELDLGFPTVREVVADAPGMDGALDDTALFGARAVTATLVVKDFDGDSVNVWLDRLRAMCAPAKRIRMVVDRDGWAAPRQAWLRSNTLTCLINKTSHIYAEANLAWSAPAGVLEATTATETVVVPLLGARGLALTPGDVGDEALSLTANDVPDVAIELTPGTGQNIATITNPGSLPARPTFVIAGYCRNPVIVQRETNTKLAFDLTVPAGAQVVVDTATRKITMDGQTVYQHVDWDVSRWFDLPEGVSSLGFDADDQSEGCLLNVSFYPRYL